VNIKVHIERLVLEGLPVTAHDGARVQCAVGKELARLIAEGGLSDELCSDGAVPEIRATPFAFAKQSHPTRVARQIARSIYGRVGK
jgi:hypothetical protein